MVVTVVTGSQCRHGQWCQVVTAEKGQWVHIVTLNKAQW